MAPLYLHWVKTHLETHSAPQGCPRGWCQSFPGLQSVLRGLPGPPVRGQGCGSRFPALKLPVLPRLPEPVSRPPCTGEPRAGWAWGLSDPEVWALPSLAAPAPPHPSTRLGPPRCPRTQGPLPLALLPALGSLQGSPLPRRHG